jgi:hypothetical protein
MESQNTATSGREDAGRRSPVPFANAPLPAPGTARVTSADLCNVISSPDMPTHATLLLCARPSCARSVHSSQQTALFSSNINRLVFVTEAQCVFCEVRTELVFDKPRTKLHH